MGVCWKGGGAKLATSSGIKIIANTYTYAYSVPGTVLKPLHIHSAYSFNPHNTHMKYILLFSSLSLSYR